MDGESDVPGDLSRLNQSGNPKGEVRRGDSFQNSLFPELDTWMLNAVRKRPGINPAYLRSWMFYKEKGLLVYSVGGNRYCESTALFLSI